MGEEGREGRGQKKGGGGGWLNLPDPLVSYRRRQSDGPADKDFIDAVQHDWEDHEASK